jgi:hypothetical protein
MSAIPWLLNTAWMLKCGREAAAFGRACRRVADTQRRLLLHILSRNRDSEFGRAHGFADIRDVRAYQERVPLASYDNFFELIQRIAAGQKKVLTCEPVQLLEPTSGSTGGEKLIPYTSELRRQFQRGLAAWIHDLFQGRPGIRAGRAYWSISPALGPTRRSPGGLPIGFNDDTAYLGWSEQWGLRRLLVTPPEMARLPDMNSFRYCTLRSLLTADDLTLISVWSPTFLTALLAPLEEWFDRICFDLSHGTLSPPTPLAENIAAPLRRWFRPDPIRADHLTHILRSSARAPERLGRIWPRLALVSCWTDAAAAQFLPGLRQLFPDVEIQPKGLLATEGFVSFPLIDQSGAALALRSHFFEFEEGCRGRCRLAHQLDRGGRYRVVLTTGGGLYRYQLHDEIQVVGFRHGCPLLRFMGKSDATSDLVGEKLAEPHVRDVLDRLVATHSLRAQFALLVPILDRPPHYCLYLQAAGITEGSPLLGALRHELEGGLMENPYYRHAVYAGQLASAKIAALDSEADSAWLLYERRCLADGQKCGSIKPTALDRRTDWPLIFTGLQAKNKNKR